MNFFTTQSFRELAEEAARRSIVQEAGQQYEVRVDDRVIAYADDPEQGFMIAIDAVEYGV